MRSSGRGAIDIQTGGREERGGNAGAREAKEVERDKEELVQSAAHEEHRL